MTIEQVRQWIAVCDKAGLDMPEQVRVLDAYARVLEAEVYHLRGMLKTGEGAC